MENLACSVDKEEKTEIELIIRAYLVEWISQVANTGTNSIQMQIDRCKAYCAEHGYILPEDQMYYEIGDGTVDPNRAENY